MHPLHIAHRGQQLQRFIRTLQGFSIPLFLLACANQAGPPASAGDTWTLLKTQFISGLVLAYVDRIDGTESGWFILDSGSSRTVLDTSTAPAGTPPEHTDLQGVTPALSLFLSGVRFIPTDPQQAPLIDFLSPRLGRRVIGILGSDFFRSYRVLVDHASQTAAIANPSPRPPLEGPWHSLPLADTEPPLLHVDLSFGDSTALPLDLVLDTGALATVILWDKVSHALTLPPASATNLRRWTVSGNHSFAAYGPALLRVGQFSVPDVTVLVAPQAAYPLTPGDGLLGAQVLRCFRSIVDLSQQRLWIQNADVRSEWLRVSPLGFQLYAEGGHYQRLVVGHVEPTRRAAAAGLMEGDVLLRVNERLVSGVGLPYIFAQFERPAGCAVHLLVMRGNQAIDMTITLAD